MKPTDEARAPSSVRIPLPLALGFALFVVVLAYLVTASLVRRETMTFAPRPLRQGGLAQATALDTATIDTTDPERWRYLDLDFGLQLELPDTAGWDLALRRYNVQAPTAITDIGPVAFELASGGTDQLSVSDSDNGETYAIERWYSYSMVSHLLEPNGHVYLIRTDQGRTAKLQVLSYYCPALRAGCLTFRYREIDAS